MEIQRQADTFASRLAWGPQKVDRGAEGVERKHNPPPPVQNDDVRLMQPEESGLDYPVIVKRNPKGDGWDVIKSLG